jgi:hypothetical protein
MTYEIPDLCYERMRKLPIIYTRTLMRNDNLPVPLPPIRNRFNRKSRTAR